MSTNKTVFGAKSIHGTDPQFLIEKIIRERIYSSRYWKEKCFGLNVESILDRAVQLNHLGGIYGGNQKPTDFICLLLKLLQLQPSEEIIQTLIEAEEHKYLRCLASFYLRITGSPVKIYTTLESCLLIDFRKIRIRKGDGSFALMRIDEFAEKLLNSERFFDIILPRITKRIVLEDNELIEPRKPLIDPSEFNEFDIDHADNQEELPSKTEESLPNKQKIEKWKPEKKEKPIHQQTNTDLDEENALRAKLGLKPLK
jgi:pre-mRNA-splicing factor 38A